MLVSKYPPPRHPTIIEPFAGGAAYALKYHDRNIILYDIHKPVCEAWWFIQSPDCLDWIKILPPKVESGDKLSDMFNLDNIPRGFGEILRRAANLGAVNKSNTITKFGAIHWGRNVRKISYWHPKIQHWQIIHSDYRQSPDIEATWFIDPPYSCGPGSRYRASKKHGGLDYDELATWCKTRRGQVIVCGFEKEQWLPFTPLAPQQNFRTRNLSTKSSMEMIWVKWE